MEAARFTNSFYIFEDDCKYFNKTHNVSTSLNRDLLLRFMRNDKYYTSTVKKNEPVWYLNKFESIDIKTYSSGYYRWSSRDAFWLEKYHMDMHKDFVDYVRDSYSRAEIYENYISKNINYIDIKEIGYMKVNEITKDLYFMCSKDGKDYQINYKDVYKCMSEICLRIEL